MPIISLAMKDILGLYHIELALMVMIFLNICGIESLLFCVLMLVIWNIRAKAYISRHSCLPFGVPFFCLTMLQSQACTSSELTAIDFEDGVDGTCPEYWVCEDVSATRLYNGDWYTTPDGEYIFIIGQDVNIGKARSFPLVLPDEIDHVQYLHAGGADSGSGFWVKRLSDDTTLCHSMDGTNTDLLFEASCDGLRSYAGEIVYFLAEDNQASNWGKVLIDFIRLQDANNNNLPFCFDDLSHPNLQTCVSAVLTKIDFEDGIIGSCPDYWTCDDDSESRLYDGSWYTTSDGDTMFIIGQNEHIGKAVSNTIILPDGIDHVQYLHGGGADSGSGFWVKRTSDGATLCHFTDVNNTDILFEASCDGLTEYAGQSVYFQAEDNQNSLWGKVLIDYIRLQDINNDNLMFCFSHSAPPTIIPTPSPNPSPTTPFPTNSPTIIPTPSPTASPTTPLPTSSPSFSPTSAPTVLPTTRSVPTTIPTSSPSMMPTGSYSPSSSHSDTGGRVTISFGIVEVTVFLIIFVVLVFIVLFVCCLRRNQARKNVELEMKIAEMVSCRRNVNPQPEGAEGEFQEGIQMPTTF